MTPSEPPAGEPSTSALPVSVIVRSFNRLDACLELLAVLLDQDYPNFEILVVEQSTKATDAQSRQVAQLATGDPRLRVLSRPPLGPSGARNEGCRHARGEVLLFVDDDDIPVSRAWIRQHLENFADPTVLGVSGGDILTRDEDQSICPYASEARALRRNISYSALGRPWCYPRLRERVERVGWLRGGNASVRKSVVDRVGGWDEDAFDHEEHSFAFRLRAVMRPEERLVFDPRPVILRRNDLPGGLERRNVDVKTTFERTFDYFHRIYARYNRRRFALLYPAYPFVIFWMTLERVAESSRLDLANKCLEITRVLTLAPAWYAARAVRHARMPGADR
jgi:GT2 family glycosyltransferase